MLTKSVNSFCLSQVIRYYLNVSFMTKQIHIIKTFSQAFSESVLEDGSCLGIVESFTWNKLIERHCRGWTIYFVFMKFFQHSICIPLITMLENLHLLEIVGDVFYEKIQISQFFLNCKKKFEKIRKTYTSISDPKSQFFIRANTNFK